MDVDKTAVEGARQNDYTTRGCYDMVTRHRDGQPPTTTKGPLHVNTVPLVVEEGGPRSAGYPRATLDRWNAATDNQGQPRLVGVSHFKGHGEGGPQPPPRWADCVSQIDEVTAPGVDGSWPLYQGKTYQGKLFHTPKFFSTEDGKCDLTGAGES